MKEFKFRAFEISSQKKCSRIDYDGYNKKWTGVVEVTSPEEKGKYIGEYVVDESEIVIELYTKLKDKNGNEIYVGDIVSEHNGDIIGEIVQNPSGEYRIAWLGIYGGDSSLYYHRSLCDVIGNIHENPELLEKNKDAE